MNKDKLEYFRKKLVALREKIVGEVSALERNSLNQSLKDQSGDLSGYSIHLADAASDSYERDFNLSLASREQETLNYIDTALNKIDGGTFGACEQCSSPITEARLEAVPYATLCLECKKAQEKR
jgi:RNA polymerase-binding protein DksA